MGRAKLKVKAAQRYVPAAASQSYPHEEAHRFSAPVFVPLESVQRLEKEQRQEEKQQHRAPVEAPGSPNCRSSPPDSPAPRAASVVNDSAEINMSKEVSVHSDTEPKQLAGDKDGVDQETALEDDPADEDAEYVCCLPKVTLRRPDGVVVDAMAASLAGDGDDKASLHLGGGGRAVDPLNPVLYLDVQGGRIKLEGRLLTNRSAHIARLHVSDTNGDGSKRVVRQCDAFRGVVVIHRLEWLGALDDNSEEETRAFPDNMAVEVSGYRA